MNDLSETLGHLLCEITRARMAADQEAVRIAKVYADDPDGLLRTFPIPRMRMPNLEMTLPVVISEIPQGYTAEVLPDQLASALSDNLKQALKAESIHVSTDEIKKIIKADPNLSRGRVNDRLVDHLSQQLSDHTRKLAEKPAKAKAATAAPSSGERFKAITDIIRTQVQRTLDQLPQHPVGISVDARTQQVKEVGQGSLCLNLKLSVLEDGLEMQFEDSQEDQTKRPAIKRLVPE